MNFGRMLAVSHEASYTGAPLFLAGFLEWVQRSTDTEIHTVSLTDGPLVERFRAVGDVTVIERNGVDSMLSLANQGLSSQGIRRLAPLVHAARLRPRLWRLGDFDLTLLNSFTSIDIEPFLRAPGAVVSYVHELSFALRSHPHPSTIRLLRERPDAWITVCDEGADALSSIIGAPQDRVFVHPPFIDCRRIDARPDSSAESVRIRKRLGIPGSARIVMGSGTLDWRKGPELFLQVACEVKRIHPEEVHFVWVGGRTEGPDWERVRSDLDRSSAANVHFVGAVVDPLPLFHLADVFALTSHEDPFPLVCQEHALMRHPIVTFKNGGIVDLLESAGLESSRGVVEHLDVGALARATAAFLSDDRLSATAGWQLRQRVLTHHELESRAADLYEQLERVAQRRALGSRPSRGPS